MKYALILIGVILLLSIQATLAVVIITDPAWPYQQDEPYDIITDHYQIEFSIVPTECNNGIDVYVLNNNSEHVALLTTCQGLEQMGAQVDGFCDLGFFEEGSGYKYEIEYECSDDPGTVVGSDYGFLYYNVEEPTTTTTSTTSTTEETTTTSTSTTTSTYIANGDYHLEFSYNFGTNRYYCRIYSNSSGGISTDCIHNEIIWDSILFDDVSRSSLYGDMTSNATKTQICTHGFTSIRCRGYVQPGETCANVPTPLPNASTLYWKEIDLAVSCPTTTTTTTTTTSTTSTTIPSACSIIGCGTSCENSCVSQYNLGYCSLSGAVACITGCPTCEGYIPECTGFLVSSINPTNCEALSLLSCNFHYNNFENSCIQCLWSGDQCYNSDPATECSCPSYTISTCAGTLLGDCEGKNQSVCELYHDYWPMNCEWTNDTCVSGDVCTASCIGNGVIGVPNGCIGLNVSSCENSYDNPLYDDATQCKWFGEEIGCSTGFSCTIVTEIQTTSNYSGTVPFVDCTNLSGKLANGEVIPVAMCAYILPIGVSWVAALIMLGIIFVIYLGTKSWIPAGVAGLLLLTIFFDYFPQVFRVLAGLILAIGIVAAIAKTRIVGGKT